MGCRNKFHFVLEPKKLRMAFVNTNISAVKYGRDMEQRKANRFIKGIHKDIKLSNSGLFVDRTWPYVGASPNSILMCSCCEVTCENAPIQ